MAEHIGCRNCDSPDCKGCNLKNLETMLNNGKFDCLMNENRCINPTAEVAPVRHGRWVPTKAPFMNECEDCSVCGYRTVWGHRYNYCPNCGAYMRVEEVGNENMESDGE